MLPKTTAHKNYMDCSFLKCNGVSFPLLFTEGKVLKQNLKNKENRESYELPWMKKL